MIYIISEIYYGLFHNFTFISLVAPYFVKRHLIYNILYIIIKLPVTSISIISIRLFNL
jgi:hypothetical protein